jgi:hypothetical protein|nr:MAG TPA: hypothetical protein [Caudoviricetes sp.]
MSVEYTKAPQLLREYPTFTKLGTSSHFDGDVFIVRPTWDCGWYWGFGYLERWNSRKGDIDFHSHIDHEFGTNKDGRRVNWYEGMQELLDQGDVFENDHQRWQFLEIVKTIYNLKMTAEVLGRGGSHYAPNPLSDEIYNPIEVRRINEDLIPKLIDKMYVVLGVVPDEE